eukprot:jgi/Botrbrau1/22931/Bobra.0030s0009.1
MYPRPTSHSEALGPGCAGPALAHPAPISTFSQGPSVQLPTCGATPFMVDPATVVTQGGDPWKQTLNPYVTGTSVLGLTFAGGVLIASDTLGSYGSTKRYKSFQRVRQVNQSTAIGAGGELSDFQHIMQLLDELTTQDFTMDDKIALNPKEIYAYLSRVLYNRRNKFDPLWNSIVVGGLVDGKPFLGTVGMLGTHYSDEHVATGFGNQLARPLFRAKHKPDMTEEEAVDLIKEALEVCYYRDKQTMNKFQIARVTAAGVDISEPFALETKWDYQAFVNPSGSGAGVW